jgi:hypothetical protein
MPPTVKVNLNSIDSIKYSTLKELIRTLNQGDLSVENILFNYIDYYKQKYATTALLQLDETQYKSYIKAIFFIGLYHWGFPDFTNSKSSLALCIFRLAHKLNHIYINKIDQKIKTNLFQTYFKFNCKNKENETYTIDFKQSPVIEKVKGKKFYNQIIELELIESPNIKCIVNNANRESIIAVLDFFKCKSNAYISATSDKLCIVDNIIDIKTGMGIYHPITKYNMTSSNNWAMSGSKNLLTLTIRPPQDMAIEEYPKAEVASNQIGWINHIVIGGKKPPKAKKPTLKEKKPIKPNTKPKQKEKKPTKTSKKPPSTSRTSK